MAPRPGLYFFPADWKAEPTLKLCSEGARYLWFEMLLLMSQSTTAGYLLVAGRTPSPAEIARLTDTDPALIEGRLQELEDNGVFSRNRQGVIYSRKMVRDEKKAAIARENGRKGGNPKLRAKPAGNGSAAENDEMELPLNPSRSPPFQASDNPGLNSNLPLPNLESESSIVVLDSDSRASPANDDDDRAATPIENEFLMRCQAQGTPLQAVRKHLALWRETVPHARRHKILLAANTRGHNCFAYADCSIGRYMTELEVELKRQTAAEPEHISMEERVARILQAEAAGNA